MKKVLLILMAIMMFMIAGCSSSKKDVINHNYTYKGENELWTAEYKVKDTGKYGMKMHSVNYEYNSNKTLKVTYKKDLSKLSSAKSLEISYDSVAGGGKAVHNFKDAPPKEKTYTIKSNSKNGALAVKDDIVKVNINIDGKDQMIELKNVQ